MSLATLEDKEILNKISMYERILCERMLSNDELDLLENLENEARKRGLNIDL